MDVFGENTIGQTGQIGLNGAKRGQTEASRADFFSCRHIFMIPRFGLGSTKNGAKRGQTGPNGAKRGHMGPNIVQNGPNEVKCGQTE